MQDNNYYNKTRDKFAKTKPLLYYRFKFLYFKKRNDSLYSCRCNA